MFKKILYTFVIAVMMISPTLAQKGGRSYSSGSGRSSFSSGSSRSSSSSFGGSKSYSSPKSSYSSGSSSKSSGSSYKSSSSSSSSSSKKSSGGGMWGGTSKSSSPTYTSSPSSSKPTSSGWGSSLSSSAKKVESKKKFEAATAPKTTFKTPGSKGVEKPIKANSPHVTTVRKTVTHERYVTYDNRSSTFYGNRYAPVYYHDSFSPFLMGWILSDALNSHDRAMWMYHHKNEMDSARYNELLKKDAKLQAELDALKAANTPVNPAYVPKQMETNPDLMFNKEFINAAYNPVEVKQPEEKKSWGFIGVVGFIACCGVIGCVLYFLFIKEFK